MTKKTNKTSHVLNLLTNRIGLTPEELEQRAVPEKTREKERERTPIRLQTPVDRPAKNITLSISEQIRANLEKVEKKERTAMSMELLNRRVIPAAPPVIPHAPRVEAFSPENFGEPMTEQAGNAEEEPNDGSEEEPEEGPEEIIMINTDNEPEAPKERMVEDTGKSMDGLVMTNILEEVMRLEAPKIMDQLGMCSCERCISDALALALNSMQPMYVVTQRGALFAKIASYGNQYKTDILAKLTQACVTVRQSPSHK